MSNKNNEEFLENAKEEFAEAETPEERELIVKRVRNEGFDSQADILATTQKAE